MGTNKSGSKILPSRVKTVLLETQQTKEEPDVVNGLSEVSKRLKF